MLDVKSNNIQGLIFYRTTSNEWTCSCVLKYPLKKYTSAFTIFPSSTMEDRRHETSTSQLIIFSRRHEIKTVDEQQILQKPYT
jgi:hypothetical protein